MVDKATAAVRCVQLTRCSLQLGRRLLNDAENVLLVCSFVHAGEIVKTTISAQQKSGDATVVFRYAVIDAELMLALRQECGSEAFGTSRRRAIKALPTSAYFFGGKGKIVRHS